MKSKAQKHEDSLAHLSHGRTTPGSGNQWYRKNDVRSDQYSIEAKYTDKSQFTLKLEELLKCEKIALLDNRDPVFCIHMGGRNWYVLSELTWSPDGP